MSKNSSLIELRAELDNAITYGTKKEAFGIARCGLKEARARKLKNEIEYFKGQLELLKGHFVGAIEHFDAALAHNPKDGAAYNDRALCMAELGMIDGALSYFDKGIAAEPDYATIYHNKGWLLNNIGKHTEAIACFKKALKLDPDRPVTYDNFADALYNLSDYQGSLAAYRKVLELLKPGCCRGIRRQIRLRIKAIAGELNKEKSMSIKGEAPHGHKDNRAKK